MIKISYSDFKCDYYFTCIFMFLIISEVVELLIARYPEAVGIKCGMGLTPLGCAVAHSNNMKINLEVVEMIQQAQASLGITENINLISNNLLLQRRHQKVSSAASDSENDMLSSVDGNQKFFDESICNCIVT
jgi:hypothetical protein